MIRCILPPSAWKRARSCGRAHVDVVEGVDAESIGPVQHLADAILRVPLAHRRAEIVVVVGKSIERIDAENQAADLGVAELHLRNLDLRQRFNPVGSL
jgi:hypothetical protein